MADRERTARGIRRQFQSEYVSWNCMMLRCLNPKHEAYQRYGARGITVCDRWLSFERFLEDMGTKPDPTFTIERKENGKGYEPGNCRWATRREQVENRGVARMVEVDGERMTMGRAARQAGISKGTFAKRVDGAGLTITEALHRPVAGARLLTFDGKTLPLAEWARQQGIPETTILSRIDRLGWPLERALTTPPRTGKPRERQTRRRLN